MRYPTPAEIADQYRPDHFVVHLNHHRLSVVCDGMSEHDTICNGIDLDYMYVEHLFNHFPADDPDSTRRQYRYYNSWTLTPAQLLSLRTRRQLRLAKMLRRNQL